MLQKSDMLFAVSGMPTNALLVFFLLASIGSAQPLPDATVTSRANALLKQMTLDEKIGQLAQLAGGFGPGAERTPDLLRKGVGGSVLWVSKPEDMNRLQHIAVDQSRLHIPVIFGLDAIHGYRTVFPMPLAMAASWDPKLVEQIQSTAAREIRAAGIHWVFGPMVDIARDPRWGRLIEGAGEDPYLGAAIARAHVRGFQGPYIGSPDHVLACVKHFAGYGAADGGRDYDSVYLSEDQLWNIYLPPFEAAAKAGAGTFMTSYMDLNDVPGTGNRFLLRDVLRQTWGFRGFLVSDAFAINGLVVHGFARDRADAAQRALQAGVNMDMAAGVYLENLPSLVKQGKITEREIDDMARPILEAKVRLGLFKHPYVDASRIEPVMSDPRHRELSRTAAQRTAVLLRNEGALLPLKKDAWRRIALIGPMSDSAKDTITMWAALGAPGKTVTLLEGIRAQVGAGVTVEQAPAMQLLRRYPSMFEMLTGGAEKPWTPEKAAAEYNRALETATRADLTIVTLGEAASMSGEGASQSSLELPGRQQELLEAVAKLGKPIVLVLVNGRPLNIAWASTHIPAILEVWHPGSEGGNAVADLLFGAANPGGKLAVTWPRNAGQIPIYYAHNLTHEPETNPGFTSRYWDELSSPLYPFGYGLSYTIFTYSNLKLKRSEVKLGETVEVTVDVQNTGQRAGDEVAQLYIHQQAGSASRPVRELKGFERLTLAPGEKKTVTFHLGKDELRYWSAADRKWVLEPEQFDVWAGGDSTAALHANFRLIP